MCLFRHLSSAPTKEVGPTTNSPDLYAGQEAAGRTGHGTTDRFQIGKGVLKAVYCLPAYLTYMQNTS